MLLTAMANWEETHGYPFRFITEASLNLADDCELLKSMKSAGFTSVFIGIETPDETSLAEAHKLQNTHRDLLESIAAIQQSGIEVMGGFILGFDNDREDVFDRLVDFIQKSAIPIAMVGLLQAMPGTQLFRRLSREGRIQNIGSGNNTTCELNFLPRMNADRLVEGYRAVLHRIYDCDAYYERVIAYLGRCRPHYKLKIRFCSVRALFLSIVCQGLLGKGRRSYWKFLLTAATRYRSSFGAAMTMAVMGYHFGIITGRLSKSDS